MARLSKLSVGKRQAFNKAIRLGLDQGMSASEVQVHIENLVGIRFSLRMIQVHMKNMRKDDTEAVVCYEKGTGSDTKELTAECQRVITLEDALKKGNVDLTRWDVDRYVINSWEVGAKGPDRLIRVTPLWQVKVWLKAKKGWDPSEFRRLLVDDLKKAAPMYDASKWPHPGGEEREPLLAELSIFDAHFGKLAWGPETGQDYDVKICANRYLEAALSRHGLVWRALAEKPERFLYVVGNDFFHVDHKGCTYNGTPQDVDGRWQKAFRAGKDCCIQIIEAIAEHCPIDVLVVAGNHDEEKIFCLGEVLAARFHQHSGVNILNDPDPFCYYRWGRNLIGFVHGQNHTSEKKRAQLPIQMLNDRPVDCADTIWREWHLGHLHSEREECWRYRSVERIRDVAVRILPSLSSTDAWHRNSGYHSVLAAECHLYHRQYGRWGYKVFQTEP